MLCARSFAPALFNSNVNVNELDTRLNAKSNHFKYLTNINLLLRLESMYSELIKKINRCKKFSFAIQPTYKNTG